MQSGGCHMSGVIYFVDFLLKGDGLLIKRRIASSIDPDETARMGVKEIKFLRADCKDWSDYADAFVYLFSVLELSITKTCLYDFDPLKGQI